MTRLPWFRATVIVQLLVFAGWIGLEEMKRIPATTVVLETVPVDPRDLWSGQYLTLAYRISGIDHLPGFPKDRPRKASFTVAVRLVPAEVKGRDGASRTVWQAVECAMGGIPEDRPTGGVWVKATWSSRGRGADYGIGRYYFSESRKDEMNALAAGRFFVECGVSRSGQLTIRRIVE